MNRYELTYIIDANLEETARKELIERFSGIIRQNGGEVEKVDETWGKRRLAYPINDMLEGYYVLVTFQSDGNLPREIERNLEINESVLRYLIIKQVEKKQSVKPRPIRMTPIAAPPAEAFPAEDPSPIAEETPLPADAKAEAPAMPEEPAATDSPEPDPPAEPIAEEADKPEADPQELSESPAE